MAGLPGIIGRTARFVVAPLSRMDLFILALLMGTYMPSESLTDVCVGADEPEPACKQSRVPRMACLWPHLITLLIRFPMVPETVSGKDSWPEEWSPSLWRLLMVLSLRRSPARLEWSWI